jgi:nitronate monooxygenase
VFDLVRGYDWPTRFTGRALGNRLSERWHGRETELQAQVAEERERYLASARAGDVSSAVVWASEAVDLIRDLPPAAELIERMIGEATAALERAVALRGDPGR